jgi:pimeloyl-ACP methyl ester carboxylesterase
MISNTQRLPDGSTICYQRRGNGQPLLLLHTLRTQAEYFDAVAPRLAERYTVYTLDLPGHGRSSLTAANYDEPTLRAGVREFIEANRLTDLTLVGESIGGVLALTIATEIPQRIARIVSVNPYDYGERFPGGIRRSRNGWILSLFALFGPYTIETKGALAAVLRGGFHDPTRLSEQFVALLDNSGRRKGARRAEYSLYKSWHSWIDARSLYVRVNRPVDLVYSSDDWSLPQDRKANRMALKPKTFCTIYDMGHFLSLENPLAVITTVFDPVNCDY